MKSLQLVPHDRLNDIVTHKYKRGTTNVTLSLQTSQVLLYILHSDPTKTKNLLFH